MGAAREMMEEGDERPLRLLSLDGGGIRGLSSILILKEIMAQVNRDRKAGETLQPWQVFDLMGGTSTGGIIAIMLGRLRMTLEECERAYLELSQKIFRPKRCRYSPMRLVDGLSLSERFDSKVLELLMKRVIKEKTGDAHALLRDGESDGEGCNVFVCTVLEHNSKPALLRSYDSARDGELGPEEFKVWQACRATSAATSYFAPHTQGQLRFVDGALAHNNPVFQVAIEANDLWKGRPAVLISIGTGRAPPRGLDGNAFRLARALPKLVTQTETTADSFERSNSWMADQGYSDPLPFNPFQYETVADCWREVYHRFSVDGLGVVGLGDAKKIGVLQTQTLAYLRQKRTVGQLESCVDALVHKERAIPRRLRPTSIPELTKMEHDCLRALYSAGGSYDTQRVAVERAVPGTCEWFLGHPDFVDWVSSDAAGVLWVTANAGCGKSVMSGFLADALASTARNLTVCSFFFKGGQDHRHEAYNGLCALLHQGILADPSAASLAATQFSSKEPGAFSEALEQLWSVFCRLAEQSPRPVVCILDALDECSAASRDRLIGLLAASFGGPDSKTPAPKNLKFLVTSRPYPEIEERFHSLRAIRLRGEDEAAAVSRDVESVVRHKVDEMRRRSALSPEGCALVEATLLRRAGATFLWVALVLDLLARLPSRKLRAVRALLEQIPDDLEQLYEHGLAETPRPDDTRRLLQILLVGSRPLRVEEVNIALNIREGTATLRELDDELEPNAEYTIGLLGRFFVKISQGLVFLVHETAREFLLRDAGHPVTTNGSWKHSIGLTESNSLLMRASITYLLLRDWPRRQTRPTKFEEQRRSNSVFLGELGNNYRDFYAYSAENWPLHAERGGEVAGNGPPNQQIQTLCDPESRTFKAWWYFYADYQFYEDIGGRIAGCSGTHHPHFAALRGDWAVLQGFLARGLSLSAKNTKGFDVLAVAVASKRWQVAGRLLDLSDPKQMQLETAMMCAIYYQHTGLVQRFIDLGVSVNQRHTHPLADLRPVEMLPLDAALNRPSVLPMLLDAGAEIKDTQLVECATMGWVKDLEVLFEADRARRSEENRLPGFQKALEAATSGARLKARRLILQQSDRIEDKYDLAPGFSAAAWRGDVDAVSELLTMGARDDGSALREAAQYAGTEITELLLDAMDYPQAALDKALAEFFDQVNAGIDRHLLTLLKKKDGDSGETVRPHKAVERTLAISESNEVTCGYLSLLLDKGARLPATVVHDVILRLIPMDEDFCVFVLENLGSLQKGDTLLSATAYLSVACFWARERVVRLILDGGASVGGPDAVGVTPLVAAVASGDVGMVRLLLAKGALDGTDQDGGPSGSPAAGGRGSSSCEPLEAPWSVWEAFWQAAGVDDTNSTAMDAARSKGYKDIEMELTGWLSVHGA